MVVRYQGQRISDKLTYSILVKAGFYQKRERSPSPRLGLVKERTQNSLSKVLPKGESLSDKNTEMVKNH
jgi:hypothetical protein